MQALGEAKEKATKHLEQKLEALAEGDLHLAQAVSNALELRPTAARAIAYALSRDAYATGVRTHIELEDLGVDADDLPDYMRQGGIYASAESPLRDILGETLGAKGSLPPAVRAALKNEEADWPVIAGLLVAVMLRHNLDLDDIEGVS